MIVLVFGKICSGKGTFAEKFVHHHHIVTSDIVKQVSGFNKRSDLHGTKSLDVQIAEEMVDQIEYQLSMGSKVVIDGIRQKSIVQQLQRHFGENAIEMIWLHVPERILEQRYHNRGDAKDNQNFQEALNKDAELGLEELEQWLMEWPNIMVVSN